MPDRADSKFAVQHIDMLEAAIAKRDALEAETQRISGVGIWHYDPVSGAVVWSDEMFRIFGVSADTFEPSFENFLACVHPDDREAMAAEDRKSTTSDEPMSFEHRIIRPDGEVRYVHERAQTVIRDELGVHPLLLGTTQDITARREAEATVAAQAAEMKEMQAELNFLSRQSAMSTMAAVLAHEINQPLTAITNYASGLRRIAGASDPGGPIAEGLAEIETSALRAGDIIRRMRAMAQRREAKKERIDFDGLARSAVRFAGTGCEGVSIEFDCRAEGIVLADRIQIEQVLVNLIKNACEAMQHADEGSVTVSTADSVDGVTICISDTGPGIAPDPHLFEATVSSKPHGMGIGLSICRTIVEAHHGRIWVEHPPRGARFCFSLPRADTA